MTRVRLDEQSTAIQLREMSPGQEVPDHYLRMHLLQSLANAPQVLRGYSELIGRLSVATTLDARLRELVTYAVARECGSNYVAEKHRPLALEAGVTEAELGALDAQRHSSLQPSERQCVEFALAVERQEVSDAHTTGLRALGFADEQIVELAMVAAAYGMTARYLDALDVELEPFVTA